MGRLVFPRRAATAPDSAPRELVGILNVWKPRGWTSHDVVARVRRLAGQRRVGHAGTLDPLAEGVLPVLMGRATRLADVVGEGQKRYRAEVQLGASTTTDDLEGEVVERRPVPPLEAARLAEAAARFQGAVIQVPPAYSAIKVGGQHAYDLARQGRSPAMTPRLVTIYTIEAGKADDSALWLDVTCSRGTYIRALARDLALALGTLGHLRLLTRLQVGPFGAETAVTLEDLERHGVAAALLLPEAALPEAPSAYLAPPELAALRNGRSVECALPPAELVRVYASGGLRMEMVGRTDGTVLRPRITLYPAMPGVAEAA